MRTLSIVALQAAPVFRDPAATVALLAQRARAVRAAVPHAQLLVLPELHPSAPPALLEEHGGHAERAAVEVPGPVTDSLGAIAHDTGLWLVPGSLYERGEEGRIHNTAVVLSPDGELVTSYRKVFPWQPHETSDPGDSFVTFDIPDIGRVGLAICYDGNFPETYRQLAWMGAEVVLQPALTTTSDRDAELVMTRANAIFNQLYAVSVNAPAPAGNGRSIVVDPEGLVRAQAGDSQEMVSDVLDLDAVTRVRKFGTAGVSRMWDQIERERGRVRWPMYQDTDVRA